MECLLNNNNVIIFVVSKNKSNMGKLEKGGVSKEQIKLEKELLFYLRYYKELQDRGHYKQELDYQIELLTKKLKEM